MNQRFYEKDPTVKRSVETLLALPFDVQTIVAEGSVLIAERECQAATVLTNIKSLGTEKVLALYKSRQQRREYDKNRTVHRMMAYLMALTPEHQNLLARKMIELTGFANDYLQVCEQQSEAPQNEVLESISSTYVRFGPRHAKAFVMAIKQELGALNGRTTATGTKVEAPGQEAIHNRKGDMRVSGFNEPPQ